MRFVWFVQWWFLAHFLDFYNVDDNANYILNYLLRPNRRYREGNGVGKTYRALFDRLEMDDIWWRPYEEHKEIQAFEEIFCYSSWIMCDVEKVYRHLLERVERKYRYVQDVPRPPTNVVQMRDSNIVKGFLDFRLHTIKEDNWGNPAWDMPWRMDMCYGTNMRLTLRFYHLFWDLLRGQQMRSRSLHTRGSSTRREARLILMIWLVVLFARMKITWIKRGWKWAVVCGIVPC